LERDRPWEPRFLALDGRPARRLLTDFGPDGPGSRPLSDLAITEPFRLLSDEGVAVLQELCAELARDTKGNRRTKRYHRGSLYQSAFLAGLYRDPELLAFLRDLAGAPLEPHPVTHHALQFNFTPEVGLAVDEWHVDMVSFDIVLMVSDPRGMRGGRFQYFDGPVEEGRRLLERDAAIPAERVRSPQIPGAGWAMLQQGHRVLHRVAPLEEAYDRVTAVASYFVLDPAFPDPSEGNDPLPSSTGPVTLGDYDGADIALVEWSRFAALTTARRLERFATEVDRFGAPADTLLRELETSLGAATQAARHLRRALGTGED
jgi:hypothetical protein